MKKLVTLLSVLIFTLGVSLPSFATVKVLNTTKNYVVVAKSNEKVTENDNATENATKKEKKEKRRRRHRRIRRMEGC